MVEWCGWETQEGEVMRLDGTPQRIELHPSNDADKAACQRMIDHYRDGTLTIYWGDADKGGSALIINTSSMSSQAGRERLANLQPDELPGMPLADASPSSMPTMPAPFAVGECVRLKSGSPLMCVCHIRRDECETFISTDWFDGATRHADDFYAACLERAIPEGERVTSGLDRSKEWAAKLLPVDIGRVPLDPDLRSDADCVQSADNARIVRPKPE